MMSESIIYMYSKTARRTVILMDLVFPIWLRYLVECHASYVTTNIYQILDDIHKSTLYPKGNRLQLSKWHWSDISQHWTFNLQISANLLPLKILLYPHRENGSEYIRHSRYASRYLRLLSFHSPWTFTHLNRRTTCLIVPYPITYRCDAIILDTVLWVIPLLIATIYLLFIQVS